MSLDQNLFTLHITPRVSDPSIVELVDPSETVHYRKERTDDGKYSFNVYDPLSESLLATVTAPTATSKQKQIELHNPTVAVELKYTGTIQFRWSFLWEEHEFEWKREECHILRKPDPPVLVAVTREPPGRIKTKAVQILDYNLNRFDIQDRKGLEIVMLSALLSFQDYSVDIHTSKREESSSSTVTKANIKNQDTPPPERPPKNIKTGVERIAELQFGDLNEVSVEEEGSIADYAQYCHNLLEGDHMLFVTLRSTSAATVPKVLQVAHQAKRLRHRDGEEQELHQYVLYDTDSSTSPGPSGTVGKKGPKIIKLDDDGGKDKDKKDKDKDKDKDRYKPPESLTIHLSKIPMPELQPKSKPDARDKDKGKDKHGWLGSNKDDKGKSALRPKSQDTRPHSRPRSPEGGAMNAAPTLSKPDPKKVKHPSPQPTATPSSSLSPYGPYVPGPPAPGNPRPVSPNSSPWMPSSAPAPVGVGGSPPRPPPPERPSTTSLVTGLFDRLRTR